MNNREQIELLLHVTTAVCLLEIDSNFPKYKTSLLFIHAPIAYDRQQHKLIVRVENKEDLPVMPEALGIQENALTFFAVSPEEVEEVVKLIQEQSHIKLKNLSIHVHVKQNAFFPSAKGSAKGTALEAYILTEGAVYKDC